MVNIFEYSAVVGKLRDFFVSRGFVEVPTQSRLSILAACEDPYTVGRFEIGSQVWPLPQTGQMWLERELLEHPEIPGVFCISTSYRDEPNPIPGRHERVFPMFEFESRGDMTDLIDLEKNLLIHLGLDSGMTEIPYEKACEMYGVSNVCTDCETRLAEDVSKAVFLKHFPLRTHPFWNMKQIDGSEYFSKVDVILHGMETIGSAERSCDADEMRHNFYYISNGGYSAKLFELFGRERVEEELESFLKLPMTKRFGGGIGLTRLIRAMKLGKSLTSAKEPALVA
jgi:aspartyl/asparaginyl-tRNA synthetase